MEFSTEEDDAEYEDVLMVADTLVQLRRLFRRETESGNRRAYTFNLRWGAKGKRSDRSPPNDAVGPAPAPAPAHARAAPEPAPVESRPSKVWTEASSPDTPLLASYSGGSSDPKSATAAATKRKPVKRAREVLRLAEAEAQRENDSLKVVSCQEIKNLRRKIDRENSLNTELKRTRKLLIRGKENEKAQWEEEVDTCLTLGVLSSSPAKEPYPHVPVLSVPEPLIPDRTAVRADKNSNSGAGPRESPSLRPGVVLLNLSLDRARSLPDLNVPLEENGSNSPPQDHPIPGSRLLSRTAAAEARMRRHLIMKAKLRRAA
ncbi:uncharacterized protein LOC116194151 isoform X1 [Punica granatum]|uniref:Uncharacterized protein LOC116194151 isoform X1 n=1 Tax=Punica granatum TaxID=22663 RepID=A0A6P8C8H8_PUNGR|nr:uncharacterized protein LOC116194151 isoform X1 [Punica granatum]